MALPLGAAGSEVVPTWHNNERIFTYWQKRVTTAPCPPNVVVTLRYFRLLRHCAAGRWWQELSTIIGNWGDNLWSIFSLFLQGVDNHSSRRVWMIVFRRWSTALPHPSNCALLSSIFKERKRHKMSHGKGERGALFVWPYLEDPLTFFFLFQWERKINITTEKWNSTWAGIGKRCMVCHQRPVTSNVSKRSIICSTRNPN